MSANKLRERPAGSGVSTTRGPKPAILSIRPHHAFRVELVQTGDDFVVRRPLFYAAATIAAPTGSRFCASIHALRKIN
jgi:hypothetical protein